MCAFIRADGARRGNARLTGACAVQLDMDDFAFEASDDVIEDGGRFVQPGSFTIFVEDLSFKLTVAGDPLRQGDWLRLDNKTERSKPTGSLF